MKRLAFHSVFYIPTQYSIFLWKIHRKMDSREWGGSRSHSALRYPHSVSSAVSFGEFIKRWILGSGVVHVRTQLYVIPTLLVNEFNDHSLMVGHKSAVILGNDLAANGSGFVIMEAEVDLVVCEFSVIVVCAIHS